MERDEGTLITYIEEDISTHTLTWSVTYAYILNYKATSISTHTLTWSVTRIFFMENMTNTNFNSHAHVERDQLVKPVPTVVTHFNSHAHVERDHSLALRVCSTNNFNSHAHVERDNSFLCDTLWLAYFNSHAHVERDFMYRNIAFFSYISTHTLTWSVTHVLGVLRPKNQFQLTRSRGA